jgi:hypothetical protein
VCILILLIATCAVMSACAVYIQVLALQGLADAAENILPPVLLLARADTAATVGLDNIGGALSLEDAKKGSEADEDLESDREALRLNRFEWGTEEWSQAILPVPNYTVRTKDGFSAYVKGFDPSTACSATLLRPRALGNVNEDDVGALVVCGEVALDGQSSGDDSQAEHHVLQIYEPPMQEWCGLPAPTVERRFPVLLGLADGALLLVCGYDKSGSLIKSAEILHQRTPVRNQQSRVPPPGYIRWLILQSLESLLVRWHVLTVRKRRAPPSV